MIEKKSTLLEAAGHQGLSNKNSSDYHEIKAVPIPAEVCGQNGGKGGQNQTIYKFKHFDEPALLFLHTKDAIQFSRSLAF